MNGMDGTEAPGEVTQLLAKLDSDAADVSPQILQLVYAQLRRQAGRMMGAQFGQTLQPTALVHEAWMKLDGQLAGVRDRTHFFALTGLAMRQILRDRARRARTVKRDGVRVDAPLDMLAKESDGQDAELIALDDALTKLQTLHARQAEVATLRFLGGMTLEETAQVVGVSTTTAGKDWAMARAWLRTELDR